MRLADLYGSSNIGVGYGALRYSNAQGNTALGTFAMNGAPNRGNTGHDNTAIGYSALYNNTGGGYNTAIGDRALNNNLTGSSNVALARRLAIIRASAAITFTSAPECAASLTKATPVISAASGVKPLPGSGRLC